MAHMLLLVIGDNVYEQVDFYHEDLGRTAYRDTPISPEEVREMQEEFHVDTLEPLTREVSGWFGYAGCKIEGFVEGDRLIKREFYNPNTKYDGCRLLEHDPFKWVLLSGRKSAEACKKEVDWQHHYVTYAIIKDGQWYECEDWYDSAARQKWEVFWKEIIESLPGETLLTLMDCHW